MKEKAMKLTHLLAAASLCISAVAANATTITQTAPQTSDGQQFSFVFNGLSTSFTGGGTLTFTARGDYSPTFSSAANTLETLAGSAEGINFGNMGFDDADTRTAFRFDDNLWSRSFALSNAQLTTLLADGVLIVDAFLTSGVNLFNPATAYAGVSFDYTPGAAAVPEPATLGLFGLALAGFGAARRRRQ